MSGLPARLAYMYYIDYRGLLSGPNPNNIYSQRFAGRAYHIVEARRKGAKRKLRRKEIEIEEWIIKIIRSMKVHVQVKVKVREKGANKKKCLAKQ